jgi:hypothetical protein
MKESALGIVDVHAGRDVHGAHEAKAIENFGARHRLFDRFGDVDQSVALRQTNMQVLRMVDVDSTFLVRDELALAESGTGMGTEQPVFGVQHPIIS